MYNDNVLICKQEVIITIYDYMIPVSCCQKNKYLITFTTDDIVSKFEVFLNKKLDTLHLTEIMII